MRSWVAIFVLTCSSSLWAASSWISANSSIPNQPSTVSVEAGGENAWRIQVSVAGFTVNPVVMDGRVFDRIELPSETFSDVQNMAELPAISRMIGLRSSGDPTLEVVSEEWGDADGTYTIAPPEDVKASSETIMRDAFFPESPYSITPRQVMGGVSLCDIQIAAMRYNPVQHKVRVLRNLTVQVHENGAAIAYPRGITETIAQCLRATVSNWNELALDELVVRGTLLYITADTTVAPLQIQQLVTWRTRKGYRVEVAGPGQIGRPLSTSNVKSYIQSRYNNANPPLEFVCMVGDGNGSYVVPSYLYHAPDEVGVEGVGGFGFTQLDGTDLLPDVAIGRFFFTSSPELLTQVNKTLRYEQTPVARNTGTHPNWYEAAGVVGDYDNQALSVSHIQTMRWVRERMLDAGYPSSSIDTLFWTQYGTAIPPSVIIASLNSGASLWCYRGWNRMNNFPVASISGLNNVGDWPFMLNMTCNTNDFNQSDVSCLGEAFMVPNASPTNPAGAIGFVGMSSGGTHSRFNNIQMGGAVQGLLREGIHTTGGSLMRAKLEMHHNFPLYADSVEVNFFCGITSLLGDPAVDVYTDTPDTLTVNNPVSVQVGTNSLILAVTKQGGLPVDSAYVNLVKGTEVFVGGNTDVSGHITLNFLTTSAETLFVTATKHNCLAAIRYTLVTASSQYVAPPSSTFVIDDDNNGTSHGNGDGHANPGEAIKFPVPLKNWGSSAAMGVNGTLSTSDPFISNITDATENYGNIASGATVSSNDDYDFAVADYAPDGHIVQFTLTVVDANSHTWISTIPVTLANAKLNYVGATLTGVGNGILDPGETGQIYVTLVNSGALALAAGRVGYLRSADAAVVITDSVGTFAAFSVNGQGNNQGNPFGISATSQAIPGERVPLTCIFPLVNGFADTVNFTLTIGTVASNTPTPPDNYGYWAFDNTDTGYVRHPTFNWVEIDPDSGGSGTQLSLEDESDGADASMVVNLPFSFTYYGQSFNQITVCTNGWLAMGADQVVHTDFRNYDIPSAMGPTGLIAPFWDDLRTSHPAGDFVDRPDNGERRQLDDGGEGCSSAAVISSLPYSDTGNTCQHTSSSCSAGGNSTPDVFYRYTVPTGGQNLSISLCGSQYNTRLLVWNACCTSGGLLDRDNASCTDGHAKIIDMFSAGNIWIMIEGYGQGPQTCGQYSLSVTQYSEIPAGHVCTYNDAANHRFIVEWSRVFKYNGSSNPHETFECVLYQPGYPQTPTGDGEILFQYFNITNTVDISASNDYCTAGIENLDQTDGVLYSYFNLTSPTIPGAASLTSGRAVLFTTAQLPPTPPRVPSGLTIFGTGNSALLRWRPVTQDVEGHTITYVQYNIYRGTQGDFTPSTATLVATVSDTTYTDDVGTTARYFYIIQAVAGGASSMLAPPPRPAVSPQ